MSKTTLPSLNRLSARISSTLKLTAALAAALAVFRGPDADAATLTWIGSTGASSNVWDVGITTNWLSGGLPSVFNNGDAVVFDDTGTNIPTVKLTTTVLPASVTVNSASAYTFTNSGSAGIGGSGKLIKLGSGNLYLRGANTYSGGTTNISAFLGRLQIFDANALGTGALTINGGGGLNFGASVAAGNSGLGLTNNIIVLVSCGNSANGFAGKLSGKISGRGGWDWNGFTSGSLALSGDNSGWSGNFSFSGPGITLYLGHTNALGSGTVTVTMDVATMKPVLSAAADLSGGLGVTNAIVVRGNPLTFNLTNDLLLSGPISGASNFVKSGSATLILSGSNTFTGNLTNTAGTLKVGSSNALGSGVLVMNGGTLGTVAAVTLTNNVVMAANSMVANTNDLTLSGVISGSATLTKSNWATLTLSGTNALTGRVIVKNSTLGVNGSQATLSSVSSVTVTNDAQLAFLRTMTNTTPVTLTGSGSWSTIGRGSMGSLLVSGASGIRVTHNTNITLAAMSPWDRVRIGGYAGSHTTVLNGVIGGTGSLSLFTGGGAANHWGKFFLNQQSLYSGDTYLDLGSANNFTTLGVDNALPPTTVLTLGAFANVVSTNYSQLILDGHNQTLVGIVSATNVNGVVTNRITGGNAALSTLTVSNAVDDTFIGVLGGDSATDNNLALVKTGVGKLTVTRANTYSGGTTVSNGFLNVANTGGSGTGSGFVAVKPGGSLGGTGVITGPATVNSGGTLSPGDVGTGQLRISNALTLAAGSTTVMELNKSTGTSDAVVGLTSVSYGGTLTVTNLGGALAAGDSFKLFDAASYSGSFAAIVPAAPGAWMAWDTSTLANDGTLRIVAVCEVNFVSQPVGRAAVVGSAVSFSVVAHTTTGVTNYQWQFAGLPISGATNRTLVLNSLQATNFGPYAVVVGNGLCSVPSQTAQLTQAVRPSFLPTRLNGTTISMSFPTELGPVYVVEYKDALDDATWQVLNTLNGTGNTELVTDTIANALTRFYRIRMQ